MSISEKIFFDIEKYFLLFNSLALLLYQILQPYLKIMKNELNQNQREKLLYVLEEILKDIQFKNALIKKQSDICDFDIVERACIDLFLLKKRLKLVKNCLIKNTLLED
jgi:hypothetical protein